MPSPASIAFGPTADVDHHDLRRIGFVIERHMAVAAERKRRPLGSESGYPGHGAATGGGKYVVGPLDRCSIGSKRRPGLGCRRRETPTTPPTRWASANLPRTYESACPTRAADPLTRSQRARDAGPDGLPRGRPRGHPARARPAHVRSYHRPAPISMYGFHLSAESGLHERPQSRSRRASRALVDNVRDATS